MKQANGVAWAKTYDQREKFCVRRVRNVNIKLHKRGPARNQKGTAAVSRRSEAAVQVGRGRSGLV